MSRIIIPDTTELFKNVKKVEPVYTEEYKRLTEEANERIRQTKIEQARAYLRAKNYIARTSSVDKPKVLSLKNR